MMQRDAIPDALATAPARAAGEMSAFRRMADWLPRAGDEATTRRAATRLAWAMWAVTVALIIGSMALGIYWYGVADYPGVAPRTRPILLWQDLIPNVISIIFGLVGFLAFATLGALIVTRAKERRIGWLYCAIGLTVLVDSFSGNYAVVALILAPNTLPAGLAFAWIQTWSWILPAGLLVIFLPLLYPTGRLLSRRWRPVAVCAIGLIGGGTILAALAPGPLANHLLDLPVTFANPLGVAALAPAGGILDPLFTLVLLLLVLSSAASLLLRLRHSRGEERQQLKWFAYATTFVVAVFVSDNAIYSFLPHEAMERALDAALTVLTPVTLAFLPLATGLAILRYRLYDIDLIINRTLVYGALTTLVVGLYALIVGGTSVLFQARANFLTALLATGVIAVLFQPLRGWLQRGVNRLTYGQRDEPYVVVAQLGRRLENTLAPEAMLPAIIETVAVALKLPYAAIALNRGDDLHIEAVYGTPVDAALTLPLIYQAETIGQLTLGPRQRGETFTPADRRLLKDLARQIGVAAHAVQLTADLQRSRERLVSAREEERRRLRRDLHDGLGPTLAALALKSTTISELIPTDPSAATRLSNDLYADIRATVSEIRRLVYSLRPPALDDLGLVAALRECATHSTRSSQADAGSERGEGLRVSVEAPDHLPPLPAAVEVAVYRIVQEALTNVVRHAQSRTCLVRLALAEGAERLDLVISDDGVGLPLERPIGVGLLSMRERAAELGGACVVESLPGAGTRVHAWLSISKEERKEEGDGADAAATRLDR
jgi:two-component system, NarL family, sensor kinase